MTGFMDLPPELRNMVYKIVLQSEGMWFTETAERHQRSPLGLVGGQVGTEYNKMLTKFAFDVDSSIEADVRDFDFSHLLAFIGKMERRKETNWAQFETPADRNLIPKRMFVVYLLMPSDVDKKRLAEWTRWARKSKRAGIDIYYEICADEVFTWEVQKAVDQLTALKYDRVINDMLDVMEFWIDDKESDGHNERVLRGHISDDEEEHSFFCSECGEYHDLDM